MIRNKRSNSCTKIDTAIHSFIDRYFFHILVAVIILISLYIRISFRYYSSSDIEKFVGPWLKHYEELGVVEGLRQGVGNYYIPYNVCLALISQLPFSHVALVGMLSWVFDYLTVFYIYKILVSVFCVNTVASRHKYLLWSLCILFLPYVMLNGAYWKQCDGIYTFFLIAGLYYLMKDHFSCAFILFAIGFSFKQQVIFIIPFLIILYVVKKNYSILQFLWFPIVYILAGLPAVFCGRSVYDTYTVYLTGQVSASKFMNEVAANIYSLGLDNYGYLSKPAILLTIVIFGVMLMFVISNKDSMDFYRWAFLAVWCIETCYMFLPAMHDRYDYSALVLITAILVLLNHKIIIPVVVMNFVSLELYCRYLFYYEMNVYCLSIAYCAAYFWISYELIRVIRNRECRPESVIIS